MRSRTACRAPRSALKASRRSSVPSSTIISFSQWLVACRVLSKTSRPVLLMDSSCRSWSGRPAFHPLLVQPLAQQADRVAASEQLAFENEGRHPENARGLGLVAQAIVFSSALPCQEGRKVRWCADLDHDGRQGVDAFRIELPAPEAVKDEIVIGAENVLPGIEHAGIGRPGIEDLERALERQALLVGEAACIHVAAHAPPVMGS